jgi:hypothetical protein
VDRLKRVALPWLWPGGAVLLVSVGLIAMGDDALLRQVTGQYRWVVYGLTAALAGGFTAAVSSPRFSG